MDRRFNCCQAVFVLMVGFASLSAFADPTLDKLMADGKFKEAIDYADDKISAPQRDAKVWVQLGKANEALDMPEKSLACFLVSWRLNPDDYESLLGAARVYNKLGQPDNALTMAKKAVDKKFTAEASWEYARACIALNRPVEAKAALEKVIEGDSSNAIANKELGTIYADENAWDKALPLLKKTYKIQPGAELAYKIGKSYVTIKVLDSAIVYLKEAVNKGVAGNGATLELARAYYGQGNMAAATEQYQKLMNGNDLTAMDAYQAALAFEKIGKKEGAQAAYEKAVPLFGGERRSEALLAREKVARQQLDKKAFTAALGHFEFIVESDPKGAVAPDIYFLLADAYLGVDKAPQAIASLEKAIALNGKNVEAYARLADLYQKNGMPDKAKQTFEAMLALSPNDPGVYLTLGQYNLKAKKYTEALSQFSNSNSLKKSAKATEGIAIAAFNLNRIDVAEDAAESALALDQNSWDSRIILIKILLQKKDWKAAEPQLEAMVKKEPSKIEYKAQLAACYEENNEKGKLSELDKQIVIQDASNVDSRLRLARDADARNDADAALLLYRDIATLQPKNPDVLYRLYELSMKRNGFSEAASFISRFLEIKSTAEAERDYGDVLYKLKDFDRALTAYRAAIKLNPAIKGFYKRYAEIVIAKGQTDEVITALTGVVQNGEADVGTYQTLGMIYQKKGNYPKAIEMFQKALQLDAQSNEVLSALAACQAANGSLNDAIISYEQVVMMDTNATNDFKALGDIYFKQNNFAGAAKNYKRYFAKAPSDQEIARRLAKYSFEKQEYPEVIKYLAMMQYTSEADIDIGLMYAAACTSTKQYKDAIRVLEILRSLKPKGASARSVYKSLAEAYEKDGQESKAAECYGIYCSFAGSTDPDASFKYASILEKSNPAGAMKVYEHNTKLYPDDYRNYLQLGLLLSLNKETLSNAALYLKKTSVLAATVPTVWLELGKVYGKMGNSDEELDAYRKYLQTDPQNFEANKRAGIILVRKGQLSDALIFLEIANTMTPNDPDVMVALAKGYISTNRTSEAIDLLKKCKVARPDSTGIRSQLVDLYMKTGQKDNAKSEIKALVALKRDNDYLLKFAQLCIETNDLKTAESTVEDILATEADNLDVLMLKGKIQALNKNFDAAIETYKEISYINPNHAPSMVERANVYLLQSKPQWAETFFQRALKADPKSALAELGLARVCKLRKDKENYQAHLDKAKALDPFNEEIQKEAASGK
jgi:tetratricopeptide (TPR) repeat protein